MPRETILPYEKLQDVYVDQDIFVGCSRIYCDISFRNRSSYKMGKQEKCRSNWRNNS